MDSTVYESYPNLKSHIVRVAKAWAESTIAMMMPGPWAMLMSKKLLHLQGGGEGALLMPGPKDEILMSRRVLKFPVILSSNDFV